MRNAQKQEVLDCIGSLHQAHEEIRGTLNQKNTILARNMLIECQEFAVSLGENIEKLEGEGHITVVHLERYCETLFSVYEKLDDTEINVNKICKILRKSLLMVESSVKNDIHAKKEIVFFPYKVSMWDSLESVYLAAKADSDCDTYCVPIPYYDLNPDGSFGEMHYEGSEYPEDIEVIDWKDYCFEERKPDAIYFHNPYDNCNYVTSVHPRYYSSNLKKYTKLLVYIPYYSTTGGMSEGQRLCPAYLHADYIVIQSPELRIYFDERIPDKKFLSFGSPKFDRVIHKCQEPPEPPIEWKTKMEGRKVYFYNTSINGMLGNTEIFLKKMRYVFDVFRGREDVCILWRPHPLLEATFDSMRKEYKSEYDKLKMEFREENIGIIDETSDIEKTIALSDAYIGDSATSVTSLFGIVGKPLFILNNYINTLPEPDDWRGEKVNIMYDMWGNDRYQVTRNNQLWFSEKNDYHYRYYMSLGNYSGGGDYIWAIEIKDRVYVIPGNAQHLLIIEGKNIRQINFDAKKVYGGSFNNYWYNQNYIFICPFQYPLLIRFNIKTEEINYVDNIQQINVRKVGNEWRKGGICLYENELVFASPIDNQFLFMDIDTLKARKVNSNSVSNLGTQCIVLDGDDLWLLPMNGMTITRWNPKTQELREYNGRLPKGFKSIKWPYGIECEERPFGNMAFSKEGEKENIIISPTWGNMFLSFDRETGEMEEWIPPMPFASQGRNGYFRTWAMGGFVITVPQQGKADCRIMHGPERKLYNINIDTKEYEEVEIDFDYDELKEHESGYMEESDRLQYCLKECAFNSLADLLDNHITGQQFDKERQIKAFSKINVNTNGTCGENIHDYVKGKIS